MGQIDDIAARAGVSKWTAARVLSGDADYKRPTYAKRAQRIREIAASIGYQPNAAAAAVATGRFNAATLVLSRYAQRSYLPDYLLSAIQGGLASAGMHLNVAQLPDEELTDPARVPKLLRQLASDGLLINYITRIPRSMIELLERHRLPSIWINTRRDHDCVYPDDLGGAEEATRHLIELGHRRVAYLHYAPEWDAPHYSALDRRAGYLRAMAAAGLRPRVIGFNEPVADEDAHDLARGWLGSAARPTGVVTYGEGDAAVVLTAAYSLGMDVPGDLSIISFSAGGAIFPRLRLTQLYLQEGAVGETAAKMLVQKIADPSTPIGSRAIRGCILPGRSTAPAPGRAGRSRPS